MHKISNSSSRNLFILKFNKLIEIKVFNRTLTFLTQVIKIYLMRNQRPPNTKIKLSSILSKRNKAQEISNNKNMKDIKD